LVAHFTKNGYDITVTANTSGMGWVSGGGTNILYGTDTAVYAHPHPHYVFIDWTEDDVWYSEDTTYNFKVTRSRDLVANFSPALYTITTGAFPSSAGLTKGDTVVPFGTLVTVTATPFLNSTFDCWKENGVTVSHDASYKFNVIGSCHLVAHFTPKNYTITLEARPGYAGIVSGGGTYPYNTPITVDADAKPGYEFKYWEEDGQPVNTSAHWSFPVTSSRILTAVFESASCNIILTANPPEGGEVFGEEYNVPFGELRTVEAEAHPLFTFVNWTESDSVVSSAISYPFNVIRTHYLVANFTPVTVPITLLANPPEGGTLLGGGDQPVGKEITVRAVSGGCYYFNHWTENGDIVCLTEDYTFEVADARTLVAHFTKRNVSITTSAEPEEGGTVYGEYLDISCGTEVTVTAVPEWEYYFMYWTKEAEVVSYDAIYTFETSEDRHLVGHFTKNTYTITLIASPSELGKVQGDGEYPYGIPHTVFAIPKPGHSLVSWTEDGTVVSTAPEYPFTIDRDRTLTAHFDITKYIVTVTPNDTLYGTAYGGGEFLLEQIATVNAIAKRGYRFVNWTRDGDIVSNESTFTFPVTESVHLVANFYGLEFDEYAATLWDNTFMLNLNKLSDEGYDIVGCKWFKNSKHETNTHTVDEFSYSAGPKVTDLLELSPTYYTFEVTTQNGTVMYSTKKILTHYEFSHAPFRPHLIIYPNPSVSGNSFTVENVIEGTAVFVYNQLGICVGRVIAWDNIITLNLHQPAGVYMIRNENKEGKITIIK
jgi:hypothetical protein